MNPADSQNLRNCSSGSNKLNRLRWSCQLCPATSSFGSVSRNPLLCGFSRFDDWPFILAEDPSTPLDVWPGILSAKSSHQLNAAPQILSWFADWTVRSKSSIFTKVWSESHSFLLFSFSFLGWAHLIQTRKMVCPLSSKCSNHLIVFIVSFFLVDYESTYHTMSFISKTEERPRCNLFASSLSFGIRNTVKTISSLCPMSLNGMKWTIPLNSEWISAPTWNDLLDWTPYQRCDPHDFLEQ